MPFSKNNKLRKKLFVDNWLNEFPKNSTSLSKSICPNNDIGTIHLGDREIGVDCLANNPGIFRLKNILSPEECKHFIKITEKRFQRSMAEEANGSPTSQARTSSSAFLNRSEDEVVKRLEDRISRLLKIDSRQIEPLQVVHYVPGQKYDFHTDWFDNTQPHEAKHITKDLGGQREYTILIYLNDLLPEDLATDKGSTCFQQAEICAKPQMGSGVFWKNLEHGEVTHNTYHAGVAPGVSEKVAINIWTREGHWPHQPDDRDRERDREIELELERVRERELELELERVREQRMKPRRRY